MFEGRLRVEGREIALSARTPLNWQCGRFELFRQVNWRSVDLPPGACRKSAQSDRRSVRNFWRDKCCFNLRSTPPSTLPSPGEAGSVFQYWCWLTLKPHSRILVVVQPQGNAYRLVRLGPLRRLPLLLNVRRIMTHNVYFALKVFRV